VAVGVGPVVPEFDGEADELADAEADGLAGADALALADGEGASGATNVPQTFAVPCRSLRTTPESVMGTLPTFVVLASVPVDDTTRLGRTASRSIGVAHVPAHSCCFQTPGAIALRFT
jgi:hypothetical protein